MQKKLLGHRTKSPGAAQCPKILGMRLYYNVLLSNFIPEIYLQNGRYNVPTINASIMTYLCVIILR